MPASSLAVHAARGNAFVHQRRHAAEERRVHDVRMTHDPADVARGEEGAASRDRIVLAGEALRIEDVLDRGRERDRMAAGVALHAFRRAGGAAGVEDVAGLAGLEPHARHGRVDVRGTQRVPVEVATVSALERCETAIEHDRVRGLVTREPERLVEQRLVGDDLACTRSRVGRQHHLRRRIVDARRETGRCEAAEHHRVDRTDARAREHREQRFGDHRHVDQHAVTARHGERSEHRRHAIDLGVQLAKREGLLGTGLGRDVDQRGLRCARREMTIERVVADVGGAVDEPAQQRRVRIVEDLGEWRMPFDRLRFVRPEGRGILDAASIRIRVAIHRDCLLHCCCVRGRAA